MFPPVGCEGREGSGCSASSPGLVLIWLLDADFVIGVKRSLTEAFALPLPDIQASLQIPCPFSSCFFFIIEL